MLLIPIENIDQYKPSALIDVKCNYCQSLFKRRQSQIKSDHKIHGRINHYCSNKCQAQTLKTKIEVNCKQCGKLFLKIANQLKRHPNSFCNRSCSAKYNNTHKTKGTRRSKFEVYLSEILPIKYPSLQFHFNRIDAINAELDIFIPDLQLAFELNGIFHYEPIYGLEKLQRTQNNDNRKFQACLENKIELCIIDVSSVNYFKPEKVQSFVKIITDIIDLKYKRTRNTQ